MKSLRILADLAKQTVTDLAGKTANVTTQIVNSTANTVNDLDTKIADKLSKGSKHE